MLADGKSANTQLWKRQLEHFGHAEVLVWSFLPIAKWLRLVYMIKEFFEVKRLIRVFQPDVLIAYRTTSYGFLGSLTGFHPFVVAAQGEDDVWPPGHWSNFIVRRLAKRAAITADLIHVWSENMLPSILKHGVSKSKVLIRHRGIDFNRFIFKVPFINENQLIFVTTRSLNKEYNHIIIFNGILQAAMRNKHIHFIWHILGDGPLRLHLKKRALEVPDNFKVILHGAVSYETVILTLSESDVYISLPETEGFSSSLLEAMASGCIPMVSKLPANHLFINQLDNGFLLDFDEKSIADACSNVWENREYWKSKVLVNRDKAIELAEVQSSVSLFIKQYNELIDVRN
jgi:glycosyltransferase involved in cell wall biosynthesis